MSEATRDPGWRLDVDATSHEATRDGAAVQGPGDPSQEVTSTSPWIDAEHAAQWGRSARGSHGYAWTATTVSPRRADRATADASRRSWARVGAGTALHLGWIVPAFTFVEWDAPNRWLLALFVPAQLLLIAAAGAARGRARQLAKGPSRTRMWLLTVLPLVLALSAVAAAVVAVDQLRGG